MNPLQHTPSPSPLITVDADHPWIGLASFTEETQSFFFGRDAEIAEIFVRVRDNTLTMLYGQSGLGKSSLLGAGLLPKLRIEGYLPIQIRLRYDETDPPLPDQVFAEIERSGLLGTRRPATLWEWLHHRENRPQDLDTHPPVLVFDQFEEVFTLGQRAERLEEARALLIQLAELIENRSPAALRARFQEDRRLARDYDNAPTPARLVITLREDFLSHLEKWKKILPSLMRNRMALDLLDGPQALEAVVRPGRMEGRNLVDEEVGAAIVRFVAKKDEHVPLEEIGAVPPLLSLVCEELNRLRLARNLQVITKELVYSQSGEILANFYHESFSGLPETVRHFIEDRLVTEGGHRNPVAREDALTAFRRGGVAQPEVALDHLITRRLISPEERAGLIWLEITHDVLTPLVVRSRDERLERERAAEAERKIQEARKARNKLRGLLVSFSILSLAAVAGTIYGFLQTRAAMYNERIAKAEALRAESALIDSGRTKADLEVERGKMVLEQARTAAGKGESLAAIMLAGKAVGFRGYGWEESLPENQSLFPALLSDHLEHNPTAEASRLGERQKASDLICYLHPSFLPCWIRACLDEVTCVAFSPDGSRLASGSKDHGIKIWDVATGVEFATLLGHEDAISGVAFSPDCSVLASGSWDNTVKVWNASTGKEHSTLRGHKDVVATIAFSPDSSLIASGSWDHTVKIWNASTGKEQTTLRGHKDTVYSTTFSPDGSLLATGSGDRCIKIWDVANGKELTTLRGHANYVSCVSFSPDGAKIASGSFDKTLKTWDIASSRELATMWGHVHFVNSIAFGPDGTWLASGSSDGTLRLWETSTGRELACLRGQLGELQGLAISPDGTRLASASSDKRIILWDASASNELATLRAHEDLVYGIGFSPDGGRIATGSSDRTVKIWDACSGRDLATLQGHSYGISSVAFNPNGELLASSSIDTTVKLWDVSTGKEVTVLQGHSEPVISVSFSPNGTRLATGSVDNTVKIWDAATRKELFSLRGHEDSVSCVAFSPDSTRIASGSWDNTVKIWDVATGNQIATLLGHEENISFVAFSPDGTHVAARAGTNSVKLWDATTGIGLPETPDFPIKSEQTTQSTDGQIQAVIDGPAIHVYRTSPLPPNLLHFVNQGIMQIEGREVVWKKDIPLEKINTTEAIQYHHPLARLRDPNLPAEERVILKLRLCGRQWRAGLAVWSQFLKDSPALADSAPARRELLIFAAATLQHLARAEKPTAPNELCKAITDHLRAEDFSDLRISLSIAKVSAILLDKSSNITPSLPMEVREAFLAHLIQTAPQSWKEAVLNHE